MKWPGIACPERASGSTATVRTFFIPGGCLRTGTGPWVGMRNTRPLAGMKTTAARSPVGRAGEVMVRIVWLPIRTANTCGPVRTYVTALPRAKKTGQLSGPVPPPKTGPVAVG